MAQTSSISQGGSALSVVPGLPAPPPPRVAQSGGCARCGRVIGLLAINLVAGILPVTELLSGRRDSAYLSAALMPLFVGSVAPEVSQQHSVPVAEFFCSMATGLPSLVGMFAPADTKHNPADLVKVSLLACGAAVLAQLVRYCVSSCCSGAPAQVGGNPPALAPPVIGRPVAIQEP